MHYCHLFILILACSFLPLTVAQDTEPQPTHVFYEAVVFPDRSLTRRLEQAARLFETGRANESAIVLGGILENADIVFLRPNEDSTPTRTLNLTVDDYVINRLRNLPREARESYAFQFEPTARRLLDNAVAAGSLEDVQQVARKYFPTASGASATFLVALTQYERGDYAAAFFTLDRLKRLHPSLPETLTPVLEPMLAEVLKKLQNVAEQPQQRISEPAWLEQIGWQIPTGSPSQNPSTKTSPPLLEHNWTIPTFSRLLNERETDIISRSLDSGDDTYIPAAQPILVGDLFVSRTHNEIVAVNIHTGKRLWAASEPEYRIPSGVIFTPQYLGSNLRTTIRLFFWHNRIAQQLSSDGERLFCIDGHDFLMDQRQQFGRLPNAPGRGDDLRYDPGSTLTARDLRTGRILWQVGKFPYVQKHYDALAALPPPQRGQQAATPDDTIFTEDEQTFRGTWFLGTPLPLHGRLYVIGETDGVLQLFVLESQTGRLIAKQAFAHAQSSLSANFVRRTYPLFPSASGGVVCCPTGNGLVTALDATTLAPLWCFSYASALATTDANRRMQNLQRIAPAGNVSEATLRYIFSESGWQVPRMIIDGTRMLIAPPDRAALFCLDMLSGELLWEQTLTRAQTLYVACVYNDKVFAVTPSNILVFDMTTGKEIEPHTIAFPTTLKPAGIGVHSGDQYFIPFTKGRLAVADLNEGTLTWLDASGSPVLPPVTAMSALEISDPKASDPWFSGLEIEREIFTPDLAADDIFQKQIRFGNLVGIRGRLFTQSPVQIACFDQKEPLRQQSETSLRDNPNDAEGLMQQGRILIAEGKQSEAIAAFRTSWQSQPTPEAADALQRNLLGAMRNDFPAWAESFQELESLAEYHDDWSMFLYAQIEGLLQSGTADDFLPVLEKVFSFEPDPSILIPVNNDYSVQFHRALEGLIYQNIIKENRPALRAAWEELAETFFQRLTEDPAGFAKPSHISALPLQWTRNTIYLPQDIQRWSMFVQVFRNTRAAEKATQLLREKYEQYHLPIAMDVREKPAAVPEWSELSSPLVWRSGFVEVELDVTSEVNNALPAQNNTPRSEIDRSIDRLLGIAKNPYATRLTENQQTVPFLGAPNSEHSAHTYLLTPWEMGATDFFLCCNDPTGRERWRLMLPGVSYQDVRNMITLTGEHTLFLKGNQHLLLLVIRNTMIAIDVSSQSGRKILWSKTLSSPLVSHESSRNRSPEQRLVPDGAFPKNSVFISPHVVCVWDSNVVYGLDPRTGETLWVRKIHNDLCSIQGDDDTLFLVLPDAKQVLAIDPASGRELANGPLPEGSAYFVSGTNIVFVKQLGRSDHYALHACDLRVLLDRRLRALQISNALPSEVLHDRINPEITLLQMLHGDRFLSVANWGTKSLQIHDLLTKTTIFPDGNRVLRFVSEENMGKTWRCEVEFIEDRILVLFVKDVHIPQITDPARQTGVPSTQLTFHQITSIPSHPIGAAEMMLFDTAGNPCWSEPTKIERTHRLWDVPNRLPVMLFAVSVQTRVSVNSSVTNTTYSTQLIGIDKRTGASRFRRETEGTQRPFLHMFRITADLAAQEITFATPGFPQTIVKARFLEKESGDRKLE
ncbi:MAG: PQQ-binding-like beta-propeller repeat protein [Planctomycetaceae bacterium]|nr:PQQ-binding-like beta-propeller repeat protein [Planctomycetaceae bacterium]